MRTELHLEIQSEMFVLVLFHFFEVLEAILLQSLECISRREAAFLISRFHRDNFHKLLPRLAFRFP